MSENDTEQHDLTTCQFCDCQLPENIDLEDRDKKLQNYMEHVSEVHPEIGFITDNDRSQKTRIEDEQNAG